MDDRDLRDLENATQDQLPGLEKQIEQEAASLRTKYGWTMNMSAERQAAEASLTEKEARRDALHEQLRSVRQRRHDLAEAETWERARAASHGHLGREVVSAAGPTPSAGSQKTAEDKMGVGGFIGAAVFGLVLLIFALQMIFWVLEVGVIWFAVGGALGVAMLATGRLVPLGRVLLTVGLWSGLVAVVADWSGPGWAVFVVLAVMAAIAFGVSKLPARQPAEAAAA